MLTYPPEATLAHCYHYMAMMWAIRKRDALRFVRKPAMDGSAHPPGTVRRRLNHFVGARAYQFSRASLALSRELGFKDQVWPLGSKRLD